MKIGIDYWYVISHHPDYFRNLAQRALDNGDEVHIVSAIGKGRTGTIEGEVTAKGVPFTAVHEVVFSARARSPQLKVAKARELGLAVFYDDRSDVCSAMRKAGLLALQVWRDSGSSDSDSDSEKERG